MSQEFPNHLVQYFLDAIKPVEQRRLGLELETIAYRVSDLERIDDSVVQRIMEWFARDASHVECEDDRILSVSRACGNVTLEPGGQIEFSSHPRHRIAEIQTDAQCFLESLKTIARQERIMFVACGFDPLRKRSEQRWIRKHRYMILRPFLEARGQRGLDMMTRTAATQVSLDYTSVEDLGESYILGNRLGPIVAAMFANSPYEDGRRSGYKSTRYGVWLRTDQARCGIAPAAFLKPFTIEGLVETMLQIPTVLVQREGGWVATDGRLINEFQAPTSMADFVSLISTIFTDARARTNVEMRSADACDIPNALALMALWKGLIYDPIALESAKVMVPDLDAAGCARLAEAVAIDGLGARDCGVSVLDVARNLLQIAQQGLGRIAPDERVYLSPLEERLAGGVSPADLLLDRCGDDVLAAMNALRIA